MNTCSLHFRCPGCGARIKAPVQLIGRKKHCPGCNHSLLVPRAIPEDAAPLLVVMETKDHLTLAVQSSGSAEPLRTNRLFYSARHSA
jgi:hypothetical protein